MAIIPSHVSWKQSWLPYALLLIVLVFITVSIMVFDRKAWSVRQLHGIVRHRVATIPLLSRHLNL